MIGLLSIPGALGHATAEGNPRVPSCVESRPELFAEPRVVITESSLPSAVFVAKSADVWLESKQSGLKIWAKHNFKSGQKSFVCADLPAEISTHASIPLVVLNDRTSSKKVGNSLWQFQIMAKEGKLGLWNQKSGILTVEDFLHNPKSGWKREHYTSLTEEFFLRSSQNFSDLEVTSLIRYDLVRE